VKVNVVLSKNGEVEKEDQVVHKVHILKELVKDKGAEKHHKKNAEPVLTGLCEMLWWTPNRNSNPPKRRGKPPAGKTKTSR
jgi:hypothetical protein